MDWITKIIYLVDMNYLAIAFEAVVKVFSNIENIGVVKEGVLI